MRNSNPNSHRRARDAQKRMDWVELITHRHACNRLCCVYRAKYQIQMRMRSVWSDRNALKSRKAMKRTRKRSRKIKYVIITQTQRIKQQQQKWFCFFSSEKNGNMKKRSEQWVGWIVNCNVRSYTYVGFSRKHFSLTAVFSPYWHTYDHSHSFIQRLISVCCCFAIINRIKSRKFCFLLLFV